MDTFVTAPQLTLLSRPSFMPPAHLQVQFLGEGTEGERLVEFAGRLCYMSQHNPSGKTTSEYLTNIKKQGHGSIMEHANYSILVEGVSRTLTHELVRHRAGFAYSQLSQRYVDESDTQFVVPPALLRIGGSALQAWQDARLAERDEYTSTSQYFYDQYSHITDKVHRRKTAREAARSVLPNATETKIVVTANARAWRTMLELRTSEGAEAEIRRMAVAVLRMLQAEALGFFSDFEIYVAEDGWEAGRIQYHKV